MAHDKGRAASAPSLAIARRFVTSRLEGTALTTFPGTVPDALAEAYVCQDAAIELWPDTIAGWKVGLVSPGFVAAIGEDRLAGPIFEESVRRAEARVPTRFPVFPGGFAAVEAEFILLLGRDAPQGKSDWTRAEAFDMVEAVHIGVETAGSPLATINDLGPCAIVSDFGNNAGLIVGPVLQNWRSRPIADWRCESFIDDVSVGAGRGDTLPGGPFESMRFLLGLSARRARPLKAGDLVSAGAVTGVHEIAAGHTARVVFEDAGEIVCAAEPFSAHAARAATRMR